ncbi:hypothetical protein C479_15547 [Halovivax asiaticus JCM 14624]|uniref:CHAT domain-containing protein n=1 Tax=Halovivax asiaticus JCM 14624 TaxID=1227490 RepID=M0B8G8_9EURY|nr:hypothetical protein [Halovivax asiaticus]ELZ07211.1 hypothetical protein C479_15547 [Halovivax asiaticus JCM 14624]
MIEWEVGGDHLRVVDSDRTELLVSGDLLDVARSDADISRPVDEVLSGTATELRFPHAVVYARSLGTGTQHELDPTGEALSLPAGEYVIDVDTEIKTYVRATGRVRIGRTDDFESVVISFPDRRRVLLGFRSRQEFPIGTITVPESPDALATALSHLSTSLKTASPDRSYPTLRGHPPLLSIGSELEIPDQIRSRRTKTGIEIRVPPAYEWLFVVAPLAYYLQATVETAPIDQPLLRIPDAGIEASFSPFPAFEREVERLLRKVFFLDCLVRNAGPYGTLLTEARLLDVLDLDATELYDASPAERLAAYLRVPYEAIEHRLPEWHLAMYVDPDPELLDVLPFLLDRMSLCYQPRTTELEGTELVERSLDDFYRGPSAGRSEADTPLSDAGMMKTEEDTPQSEADVVKSDTGTARFASGERREFDTARMGSGQTRSGVGEVASVDIVKPELRTGSVHGWLADGVPIDVFKSAPEAYYNRLEYLDEPAERTSICVVLNDPSMEGEHADVADIYRDRSEDLAIDVSVREGCTVSTLTDIFESSTDFVHYIGHCEDDGLRCSDGYFSAASLDRCSVETFFLNACGSYYEGRTLIERGSVAGAVTFRQVLNEHAVKVGSMFAKLLVNGFSIERALALARRRIMMGKDYAVVGDGTHTLTQGEHRTPTTITLESLADGQYHVTLECYATHVTGSYYVPHIDDNEYASLCGNQTDFILDRSTVATFLAESAAPVIYDGDLYWSQRLARRLSTDDRSA